MQGLHTVDVGILITPVIMEMLAYIGDDAGIEYNLGTDTPVNEDKIRDSQIALAMRKARERIPEAVEEAKEGEEQEPVMNEGTPEPSMAGGLMARRQQ